GRQLSRAFGKEGVAIAGAHPELGLGVGPPSPLVYRREQAGQVASGTSGRRSPQSHIQPMRRAGTPTITARAGTSPVTTAPAPTKAYSPMVAPQTMVAFAPMLAPRRTRVGRYSFLRATSERGFTTLVNTHEGPQKTWSSRVTPS